MTELVITDSRQLLVGFRYQLQSYLRTSRFLAMVIFVIVVGSALFGVVAYLVHSGQASAPTDSSAFLAGFLTFLAIIIYFSAALLGGDAISTDFGSRTGELDGVMDDHGPAGAPSGFDDGLDVERYQGAQVDDLGADALLLQGGRSRERLVHAASVADQADVGAGSLDVGLPQRN